MRERLSKLLFIILAQYGLSKLKINDHTICWKNVPLLYQEKDQDQVYSDFWVALMYLALKQMSLFFWVCVNVWKFVLVFCLFSGEYPLSLGLRTFPCLLSWGKSFVTDTTKRFYLSLIVPFTFSVRNLFSIIHWVCWNANDTQFSISP